MELIRAFIAVELSQTLKECLKSYQNELNKRAPVVRWIKIDSIHITLKFLGEIEADRIETVRKSLQNIANETGVFSLLTNQLGGFPNLKKPRVLWLGIETSEKLGKLQNRIDEITGRLGFEKESRKFSPHLTFGRIKYPQPIPALYEFTKSNPFPPFELVVKEFVLMRSTLTPKGSIYTPICRYYLDINHK